MIVSTLPLEIFGVYDRGVANEERVVLRANSPVNLSGYGLFLGFVGGQNNLFPINDQFLWLGDIMLDAPGWVFIFTGSGKSSVTTEGTTGELCQILFWNKPSVMLSDPTLMPGLVQLGAVQIGNRPNRNVQEVVKKSQGGLLNSDFLTGLSAARKR
jgi:hypothetical protein